MTDLPTAPDSVRRIGRPAHRSWSKVALTGGLALAVGLLAACGASSASGSAVAAPNESAAAPSSGQPNQSGQANPSGQGGPGRAARSAASGTIAAASPGTIQVQATSSQTTVNYADSTTITESVVADLSAVTVGSCITAAAIPAGGVGRNGAASGSAAPTTTAAPPPSAAANGPFTATIVQLRDAVNGACTGGFGAGGFGAGGFGGGPGGTPPSGAVPDAGALPGGGVPPSGGALPSGAPGAGGPGGFGQRASGTVANVAGDVITVTVTDPSTSATSTQTVNVTASTMYTKTQSAASDALVVGKCAVVQGSADAKGAVAATSIAVSTPAAGATCNAEFADGRTRGGQGGNGRGGQGGNGPGVGAAPSTTTGG